MIISLDIMKTIEDMACGDEIEKAKTICKNNNVTINRVKFSDKNNYNINGKVLGNHGIYTTSISVNKGNLDSIDCTCTRLEDGKKICKHILATIFEFDKSKEYAHLFLSDKYENETNDKSTKKQHRIYEQLISSFYQDEQEIEKSNKYIKEEKVRIEPKIMIVPNMKEVKVEFKIGNRQMYKIRDLVEFYDMMEKHTKYRYGMKLELTHDRDNFEDDSLPILDFILKYSAIMKYANSNGKDYYANIFNNSYIVVSNFVIDDLFDALNGKTIDQEELYSTKRVTFVDKEPDIKFEINENENDSSEFILTTNNDIYDYEIFEGRKKIYVLENEKLYKCEKNFNSNVLKLINIMRVNFTDKIIFNESDFSAFYSIVYPKIKDRVTINVDNDKIEKLIPSELKTKVFLDYNDKGFIVCEIRFVYKDIEFNPFSQIDVNIPRNAVQESRALDIFKDCGFLLDNKENKLVLVDEDKIFQFLKYDIEKIIPNYEILATDEFRKKQIVTPKINSIGVKIENNLLDINLSNIDFDKDEINQIMAKYKIKKKFHRLKSGDFIDLSENTSLDILETLVENANGNYVKLLEKDFKMPIYRGFYLDNILKKSEIVLKQSDTYEDLINDVYSRQISDKFPLPKNLKANLREYQQVGYDWLKTLDYYGLDGILADDMGLGKTVQVLSVILSYKENTKKEDLLPSLVVCPSSLTLNWKEESKKFTPDLNIIVINGNSDERKYKINNIKEYDMIITSYDLLKRDLEEFKNIQFRYIIADEAQYIKNNNTKNARAIKEIKSQTRFALTGTPIENSLAELWSIFDFIMPGFLFNYNKFKINYETPITKNEDEESLKKLKAMIEPFILRRLKEKVLTELPEKTITILNNEMNDEQEKIYLSYLQNAKKKANDEIEENGLANSQIKILALLMRLRQICCHPGLFIENYTGQSSKLNQCIEIMKDAIDGGHKILLFSGYSSMFPYIEEELKKYNINYFKLTGSTKVSNRMNLVNRFNIDNNIKVFLISLKAGGTGINLIGADMVIHYDPWWNLSAENQATDRTYRIGQKKNVQVYKLITKNSIEEKIYNLQEKKAKLAESMLSTNQTFISKLTKEEIMELFED